MTKKEIKDRLDSIIEKMQASFDIMWDDSLEQSYQVILTEDTCEYKYNNWLEQLFELQNKLNEEPDNQ